MKKLLIATLVSSLLLSSCVNESTEVEIATTTPETVTETVEDIRTSYPLEITNFGKPEGGGISVENVQIFEAAPKAIFSNNQATTELLVQLGLKDKIVGTSGVFNDIDPSIEAEFNTIPNIYDEYVTKEVAIGTSPDIIMGRAGLFDNADWGVGTVDDLQNLGMHTYLLNASDEDATLEDIFLDIAEIGQIFDVNDRATEFIDELRVKLEEVSNSLQGIEEIKSFTYIWGIEGDDITIYSGRDWGIIEDALSYLKMENAFPEVESAVSLESLIATDPDFLLYPTFSDPEKDNKLRDAILSNERLQDLTAVKDKAVYPMNYNYFFGYSYSTIDGILELGQMVYPDIFANSSVEAGNTAYPISFDATDNMGEVHVQTIEEAPVKVFPNNQGVAETMLKLNLDNSIVGVAAATSDIDPELLEKYNALPLLSNDANVTKELIVGANTDLVIGRSALFSDDTSWGNGTVADLNSMGIKTITQKSTLSNATINDLFQDVRDIGVIFDIQEEANALALDMENRYNALVEKSAGKEELTYVIIPQIQDNQLYIYSTADTSMHADAFKGLNLTNAYEGNTSGVVSVEQLVDINPDVIFVLSGAGAGMNGEENKDYMMNSDALSSLTSVKNESMYVYDFTAVMCFNYRLVDTLEDITETLLK